MPEWNNMGNIFEKFSSQDRCRNLTQQTGIIQIYDFWLDLETWYTHIWASIYIYLIMGRHESAHSVI